jgi:uncharacterized protein with PIN domain
LAEVKLYLDENIPPALAVILRSRGYDVVSAHEVDMRGKKDEEQLEYAIAQGRVLLTFNVRHFAPLAKSYFEQGREHPGIVVSTDVELRKLIRLTTNLLEREKPEDLKNGFVWLQSYRGSG